MASGTIKRPNNSWQDSGLSTTGTDNLNISSLTFDELMVTVDYNNNPAVYIIPKALLSSTTSYFRIGSGGSSGESACYILTATQSVIALYKVTIGGTTYTSQSTVKVYYR